jgi:hypothetical protein
MFMTDLDGVLAELRRTLAPGGHLVAAIWGAPENVPAISLSNRLVHASLGLPPPEEGAKTPFALSDVAAFRRRLEAAGFDQVRGEWVTVTYSFESAEAFTEFLRSPEFADRPPPRRPAGERLASGVRSRPRPGRARRHSTAGQCRLLRFGPALSTAIWG